MKKVFIALFAAVLALSLVACSCSCKKEPVEEPVARTYKADGDYVAFKADLNSGAPMVTTVTVTIKDDKVTAYKIDTLQSNSLGEGKYEWKAKWKTELGYEYGMFRPQAGYGKSLEEYQAWCTENEKLEWFQQANLIEAKMLADGPDSIVLDETQHFTNVAGVTVKDNAYVALAKEALQNAKDGKVIALTTNIYGGSVELDWATATIDANRKATAVEIDSLQPQVTKGGTDEAPTYTFAWKEQTKRQLGFNYGLQRGAGENKAAWSLSVEEYQAWLTAHEKLEWFQEVDLLAAHWLAGGSFELTEGKVTNVAGCTINDFYTPALAKLMLMGVTR